MNKEAKNRKEDDLLKCEESYKILFDSSVEGIIIVRLSDFIFKDANPAACNFLGYSRKELVGMHFKDIYPPDQMHWILEVFKKHVKGELFISHNVPCKKKDGTVVYADISTSTNIVIDGEESLIGFFRDATERRKTEEVVRESEAKWRSMAENAPGIVVIADRKGTIEYINKVAPGAEPVEETIGKSVYHYVDPKYHDITKKTVESVFKTGESTRYEIQALGPYGTKAWYDTWVGPLKENGEVKKVTFFVADITSRKLLEERIQKINEVLLGLGVDYSKNIESLVKVCGEVFNGTCALYNRLQGEMLHTIAEWQTPKDYNPVDKAKGHICYDVITECDRKEVFIARDLPKTKYAKTDPNVKKYGLKTYIGFPIHTGEECVGSLCVVFQEDVDFSEDDKRVLGIIAQAITSEEARECHKKALASERAFTEDTLNTLPDQFFVFNKKGRFVRWNNALSLTSGYSHKEISEMKPTDVFEGEDLKHVIEAIMRVWTEGTARVEVNMVRKDGRKVPYEYTGSLLKISGEDEMMICGIGRDISERRKIETNLKLFSDLIDQTSDGIFIVDAAEDRFLNVNRKACDSLGYTKDELLNMGVTDIENVIPNEKMWIEHINLLRKEGPQVISGEHKRKDGSVFPVEVTARLVEIEGKEYVVAVVRDITERRKYEDRLIESEARYRTIFENTGTVTAILEEDMTIAMINSEFEEFFKCSKKEVEGRKKMSEFVCEEDMDKVRNYHRLRRIDPEAAPRNYELKVCDKNKKVSETYITVALIPGTERSVVSVLDVTEMKRSEFELRRQKELLDNTNKALEHKLGELEEAMRHIKKLEGLVPICSNCKKMMRAGADPKESKSWMTLEKYISEKTDASFTHGLCPDCIKKLYGDIEKRKQGGK